MVLGMLAVVVVSVLVIMNPAWTTSIGDGLCAPLLPYRPLFTTAPVVTHAISPWWWPHDSTKGLVFQLACGPDRTPTRLSWGPPDPPTKKASPAGVVVFQLVLEPLLVDTAAPPNTKTNHHRMVVTKKKKLQGARVLPSHVEVSVLFKGVEMLVAPWAKKQS